jgi:predicted nucleic acid-binding protein
MEKVFVDASTVLSGLLFKGKESILLELGRFGAIKLVINEYVLKEVEVGLKKEIFGLMNEGRSHLMKYLLRCVSVVKDPSEESIKKYWGLLLDKEDLPILVGAKEEDCDYLVTGDKELLSSKVRKFVNSIKTSEFLRKLSEERLLRF